MSTRLSSLLLITILATLPAASASEATDANAGSGRKAPADWAASVELPAGEKSVRLFNGKDFAGWQQRSDDYFSVEGGVIRVTNADPVPRSTYLFTEKEYRDFRVLMEVKQTMGEEYSKMHSALAVLGSVEANSKTDPFGHRGPILMFCHDWGIWDAGARGRIYPPGRPQFSPIQNPPYEKIGEWNQIEALVIGDRIRLVSNGQLVVDYTEKEADRVRKGPLGLQLHNEKRPQEFRYRGLLLVENPKDRLATLNE